MTTPTPTAAELEQALRTGDDEITAEELAEARDVAYHGALVAEGTAYTAAQAAAEQAAEDRADAIADLADDIDTAAGAVPALTGLVATARTALDALADAITGHETTVRALRVRARDLDLPEPAAAGSGVGVTGSSSRPIVANDGDVVSTIAARDVLAKLVDEVATTNGLSPGRYPHSSPAQMPSVAGQLASLITS